MASKNRNREARRHRSRRNRLRAEIAAGEIDQSLGERLLAELEAIRRHAVEHRLTDTPQDKTYRRVRRAARRGDSKQVREAVAAAKPFHSEAVIKEAWAEGHADREAKLRGETLQPQQGRMGASEELQAWLVTYQAAFLTADAETAEPEGAETETAQ